jgi:hypothetical protein
MFPTCHLIVVSCSAAKPSIQLDGSGFKSSGVADGRCYSVNCCMNFGRRKALSTTSSVQHVFMLQKNRARFLFNIRSSSWICVLQPRESERSARLAIDPTS